MELHCKQIQIRQLFILLMVRHFSRKASGGGGSARLPPNESSRNRRRVEDDYEDERGARGTPDLTSIHKALFSERKSSAPSSMPFASASGSSSRADRNERQKFTVVMPKGRPGSRRH